MFSDTQQKLLRALVAAQVAVIEWGEEDVHVSGVSVVALEKCLKEALKLTKKLEG